MRSLVVYGALGVPGGWSPGRQSVTIDGVTVRCGVTRTAHTPFDADGADRGRVLVRVRAVSCNYRDKAIITSLGNVAPRRFSAFGSEFAGEVVAVGTEVTSLRTGDRVLPDLHYDGRTERAPGVPGGVPTNRASRGMHVLHARQVQRVPDTMPDAEAAAFALNAQTAYSMVRRAGPRPGESALVASASSNLSMAVLGALQGRGVRIYATTTSPDAACRLRARGLADLDDVAVVARNRAGFEADEAIDALAARAGNFDYVFDPFFDLHLSRVVGLMNPFGVYVTCGHAAQTAHAAAGSGTDVPLPLQPVMRQVMLNNLSLVGNCIGLSEDLERALRDYEAGLLPPVVLDSVFDGDTVAPFLERTFNAPDRFGKVVFRLCDD